MLLLDVDSHESQLHAGELLWRLRARDGWFVAGSSGVEYALLAAWAKAGLIGTKKEFPLPGKADRIAVVSGSVSPTTERQIRHATASGFTGIDLNPLDLLGENGNQAIEAAIADGQKALQQGNSVILNTALGPSADRGTEIDKIAGSRHKLAAASASSSAALSSAKVLPAQSLQAATLPATHCVNCMSMHSPRFCRFHKLRGRRFARHTALTPPPTASRLPSRAVRSVLTVISVRFATA
jgi:uncharacterized protein YgbK (DUF1537 family)